MGSAATGSADGGPAAQPASASATINPRGTRLIREPRPSLTICGNTLAPQRNQEENQAGAQGARRRWRGFRAAAALRSRLRASDAGGRCRGRGGRGRGPDRKSTRLNSSHVKISYAVFCLKK